MGRPPRGPRGHGGHHGNGRNGDSGHQNGGYQNGGGNGGRQWNGRGNRDGNNSGHNNNGGPQNRCNNKKNIGNDQSNNNNNNNCTHDNRGGDSWQQRWGFVLYNLIVLGKEGEHHNELRDLVATAAVALEAAVRKQQGRGKTKPEIARGLNIPWQACQKLHCLTGYLMEGYLEPDPDNDGDTPMADGDGNGGHRAHVDNTDLEKLLFDAMVGHLRKC